MKAAIVTGPNQTPIFEDFQEPRWSDGYELISVTASALSHATRALASSAHYAALNNYPRVVGTDGVGSTQAGQRVYFTMPEAPFGGMAETTLVKKENCVLLPADVDDITAAAIANPGLSSVAALKVRARLESGECVLVNGATGSAGKLAVQIARFMGARKIIATGRDSNTLEKLKSLGADVTISLLLDAVELEQALAEQFRGEGVDIILDYLYGERGEFIISSLSKESRRIKPIRYVVVGGGSGQEITLPSTVLRSVPIAIMGSGVGSVSYANLIGAASDVIRAVVPAKLEIDTTVVPLADIGKTWNQSTGKSRIVFVTTGAHFSG